MGTEGSRFAEYGPEEERLRKSNPEGDPLGRWSQLVDVESGESKGRQGWRKAMQTRLLRVRDHGSLHERGLESE